MAGLMQAEFSLLLAEQGALRFNNEQARTIRTTLREESPGYLSAVALVAEADR